MFNRELKNRIAALEFENNSTRDLFTRQFNLIENELWLLKNPPKYKVGQKVKNMIVVTAEIIESGYKYVKSNGNTTTSVYYPKHWQYKAIKKGMSSPIIID